MAWFEHDETKIHYEETGSGDPLLLVPGWGGSFEDLAGIRAALSANFRVIAADPPGSGKSSPQPRRTRRVTTLTIRGSFSRC